MNPAEDHARMARALVLARRGTGSTDPNPTVGCLIVNAGDVVGEGFTEPAGGRHAEIVALDAAGARARGATVYVSLEPCVHTGRTGPCTEALIAAGVGRVVYAVDDPNPAVAGRGATRLADAGIAVTRGLLEREATEINRGFFSRMRLGRPWFCLKMAASLDGRTALANGASQWITGDAARRDVHRQRAASSAIMTGVGTILADDPSLTARVPDAAVILRQPLRIILDSSARVPDSARTLRQDGEVIVFIGNAPDPDREARAGMLAAAGVRIERVPADPHCDLAAVAGRLAELEINTVWIEAGPVLAGAMLAAGLVDEIVLYLAPCLLGDAARGLLSLPVLESLDDRWRLTIDDLRRVGDDLRILARPAPRIGGA